MTGSALDRAFDALELLASHPAGLPLAAVVDALDIPKSAAHRLLAQLVARDYARRDELSGRYRLTTRLASIGFRFLALAGVPDIVQPTLDRLAERTGELVRLGVVDGDRQTWVAKAQGARTGLRYDPDMGMDARLSCTASGHAWLLTLSDERALELVSRQGFGLPKDYGPRAPTTIAALLPMLAEARSQGFATIDEVFAPGMSAMAAPVMRGAQAIGVISIAGPRQRLTRARMQALAPALLAATAQLGPISRSSSLFGRPPLGKA